MSDSFDDSLNSSTDSADDHQPWKAVFDNDINGMPDEPTKAGFLALA